MEEEENPVKVRLEYWKRNQVVAAVIIAALAFVLCLIIAGIAAPNIMKEQSIALIRCPPGFSENCISSTDQQVFTYTLKDFTKLNQLLYFEMIPASDITINTTINTNYNLLGYNGGISSTILNTTKNITFECVDGSCDSHTIFYLPYIYYDSYTLNYQVNDLIPVDQITFTLTYIKKEFTIFTLVLKSVFLFLSMVSQTIFLCRLGKIPFRFWSFQTRIILVMGVSLIVFNEPLLGATIAFLDPGWSGLSVFCNAQFMACMILYWLFTLQHLVKMNPIHKVLLTVGELALMVILLALTIAFYLYVTMNYRYNPTFDWRTSSQLTDRQILGAIIFLLVVFALWILVLTVWGFYRCKYEPMRERFFRVLNTAMMFLTFFATGSGAFQPVPRAAIMLLVSVAVFNIYFMLMMCLYTPSYASLCVYRNFANLKADEIQIPEPDKNEFYDINQPDEISIPNNQD